MKEKILLAVLLLLHVCITNCLAQNSEIKFNLVVGNNGESFGSGNINSITQDSQGYMWFSGQSAGCIYRYDGNRIITFKHDEQNANSPGRSVAETIYADHDGMIWIGFFNGDIDQYNPGTGIFKHYKNNPKDPGSLSAGMVSVILKDHRGRLWVGTKNGLDRLDEKAGKFIHYRNEPGNPSSLSCNYVRAIYEDRAGVLWIGTGFEFSNDTLGGLNRLNEDGTFTRFLHNPMDPNSLISNKVRAIFEDSRGVFWVGTSGDGLYTMNREKGLFERHPFDPKKPEQLSRPALKSDGNPDPITFIQEDSSGAIWIGTYTSGINRYDTNTKRITHYESSNGYPDKGCWQAYASRDGVLWLASVEGSPFLYRVVSVKKINNIETGGTVISFQNGEHGALWVGISGKGLFQYDQQMNLVHQYTFDATDSINLSRNDIFSIFQNQPDTLWLSTLGGVIQFSIKTGHFKWLRYKTDKDSLTRKFNEVPAGKIIQGKNGLIWFANFDGLVQYNPINGLTKHYYPYAKDSVTGSSNVLFDILEDSSGEIWVGTFSPGYITMDIEKGISRLNIQTGRFNYYLNRVSIFSLYRDSEGTIWAGTEKGLYKYNRKTDSFISFFDSQSGLREVMVSKIIEDDFKNLWILSASSFVKLNVDRTRYFIFGRKYGIKTESLLFCGLSKTTKGEILIGNTNGFYTFQPDDMAAENKPLKIVFSDFFINNSQILPENEGILKRPIEETSEIALKYNQNSISFHISVLDFRTPEANRVYTMLENFDNTWRESTGDKSATFINVPPGKYVFKVKANNIDGVLAEKSIQIIISPPWWKTWWAYSIYGLLMLSAIIGVHRLQRQRTIRIERQKAQVKELAQAKEIEKAYGELKTTQAQLIQSEKMASLGELTAGIAHEIQNPLNFVNNFSEVNKELVWEMKEELDKGNLAEAKAIAANIEINEDKIMHHGKRADSIVKGMLQHSRTSNGLKEPTDLNALADEYLRLSYHGLRAKDKSFNADLQTDYDQSIGKVNIIPQDIGRVLLNLYNNAFYAVADKKRQQPYGYEPTVSVSTRMINQKVEIKVADNGNGIPPNLLDKIFQPFFTTKPTGQGTGLGLSLSYDIIKAHGGELKVDSKEGEGTEFLIQIPVV